MDKARALLNSLQLKYSEDHPDVIRAKGQVERLEQLQAQIAAAQAASKGADTEENALANESAAVANMLQSHEDRIRSIDVQLSLLDEDMAALEREKNQVLGEMAATQHRVEALPTVEQAQAKVIRDYDISRENYRKLLDNKNAADLAAGLENSMKAERLVVLDPPRVPSKPIRPKRDMLISMGCVGGLALGMLMGFAIELRRGVMLGEWELPEGSTVLGRIPKVKLAVAPRKDGFTPTETKRASWPKARITLRVRSPRKRMVVAPTILLCLLGALLATSIYAGWSPF